ncbi:MAG: ribbon-helix-helix protein, CopG family [Acidobacteria bacterium]|nr:ribbon-helix-helix protein, CopG family [Acidobacteriota bacterium]
MRSQFVLDTKANKKLKRLAADRGGNRSQTIREALDALENQDSQLDAIEADPEFQKMIAESDRAIREGRVYSHEEVLAKHRELKRKGR